MKEKKEIKSEQIAGPTTAMTGTDIDDDKNVTTGTNDDASQLSNN